MDKASAYEIKLSKVTTLAEAEDIINSSDLVRGLTILPPNAADSCNQESDCEDVNEENEEIFEPAGEIEVEEYEYSELAIIR
ncbi:Hypothetical protein FKW44_016735, partial [Caligus rogercresseyi]